MDRKKHTHPHLRNSSIEWANILFFPLFLSSFSFCESLLTRYSVVLLPVRRGLEVLVWCDRLHPAKVVQHPHFGDVHLGKEPVVVGRPVRHLRVPAEQGFLGEHSLCVVYLCYRARQNNVSTERALGVIALFLTEVCLGQGHGQGGLGIHLQILHRNFHASKIHVWHASPISNRPVANGKSIGERLSLHWIVGRDRGHGRPVTLVRDKSSNSSDLLVRWNPVKVASQRQK